MWMMNQNKLRMQNLDKMCCMLMKDIGGIVRHPC